jgi:hypothetical protein
MKTHEKSRASSQLIKNMKRNDDIISIRHNGTLHLHTFTVHEFTVPFVLFIFHA